MTLSGRSATVAPMVNHAFAQPGSGTVADVSAAGDKIRPGHPLHGLIWVNPARVSGAPCFYGTRVPIKALFDSLAAGENLEEFLDGFEGVEREHAVAVLSIAGRDLAEALERL
jgi:uncharacterized protein (DUF433 family)